MSEAAFTLSDKWRQHLTITLPQAPAGAIWVHACSVGEVGSVAPLIRALLARGHNVHLSVVTATGFAHAQRLMGDRITLAYLPWDIPGCMARMIRQLRPSLLLLTETEFWPGMFAACRRQGVPIVGINTRISDRSFPRYHASRYLWRRWLAPVSLFLAQSPTDAERLCAMGVAADRVKAIGNLKYAIRAPEVDALALRQQLDPTTARPILILASTHEGEDERLLDMWPAWQAACPTLLSIIVPRHPERFERVATLVRERGIQLQRWSELNNNMAARPDMILLDGMGILPCLYSVADIVLIAGSLKQIGGHNPLEAAICGRGVVTGPHVQNFRDIMAEMQQAEAAIICADDRELEAAVLRLLQHADELKGLHAHAACFIHDRARVLQRLLTAIDPFLPQRRRVQHDERSA